MGYLVYTDSVVGPSYFSGKLPHSVEDVSWKNFFHFLVCIFCFLCIGAFGCTGRFSFFSLKGINFSSISIQDRNKGHVTICFDQFYIQFA